MSNRFKNPQLRAQYDSAIVAYQTKTRVLFNPDGTRCTGNGMASMFWRGFDGTKFGNGFTDRASRETFSYASYRAGEDAKKLLFFTLKGK